MEIKKVEYASYKECYEVTIGDKTLVITTLFGPRILHFGFTGKENILYINMNEDLSKQDEFIFYGGHRLWISPERIQTEHPDNHPCSVIEGKGELTVTSRDPVLNFDKSITIIDRQGRVVIRHRVTNHDGHLYDGALWAITCVVPQGTAFLPWRSKGDWKTNKIVYWQQWLDHATNIGSEQYSKTPDLFLIKPNGEKGKVGTSGDEGFIGITHNNYTFIKKFDRLPLTCYPDDNCAIQSFQCSDFVELETLGPLLTFTPGLTFEHTEEWILTGKGVDPGNADEIRKLL
ncbi:MAG: hypothetical protein JW881_10055 [Spirochaetales bacterium]|nr:hypothetical protein [Spirochaetales bacterium]